MHLIEQLFFFVSLLFFFAIGVPVGFALLFPCFIYLLIMGTPFVVIPQMMTQVTDNTPLLCLPFFILTGEIMNTGGVTQRIVRFTSAITGRVAGGLGIVNVGANMIFAGMSGSALADCSAIGTMLIPAMEKEGYDKDFSCAVTSAASLIGPIIPPSGAFVIIGALAGISVGALFMAGIIPGFLMGLSMMILVYFMAKKRNYPKSAPSTWNEILRAFVKAFPALLTPLIIIVGIYSGAFTPTEAAVVAAVYGLVISIFVYKDLRLKDLPGIFKKAGKVTAGIMFLLCSASFFAWIMAMEQMPQSAFSVISSISNNKYVIFLLIFGFLIFVGLFMDNVPAMIILVPVLFPITNRLGINPIHFALVMVLTLLIGLLTPPLGFVLFAISNIGNISIARLSKALFPFILLLCVIVIILIFIPKLVLYIPLELVGH